MKDSVVVATWDGTSEPHLAIDFDQEPRFDLVTFDYSGAQAAARHPRISQLISVRTECKGQIFQHTAAHLAGQNGRYAYVGLIDDDVLVRVSDINRMLHIARVFELDSFAPALSRDSIRNFEHTQRQPDHLLHWVPWVEIMAPFYREPLFMAAAAQFHQSTSGWGIDCFLMPLFQKIANMNKVAVIDAVMATHFRPMTSGTRVFSNGLTARDELVRLGQWCMRYIAERHPEWIDTEWYRISYPYTYEKLVGAST